MAAITKVVEPRFFHEAVKDPNWREAMNKEIDALEVNNTGVLRSCHSARNPLIANGYIR